MQNIQVENDEGMSNGWQPGIVADPRSNQFANGEDSIKRTVSLK